MKKFIAILLVCVFMLSMVACGKKKTADTGATTPTTSGSTEKLPEDAKAPQDNKEEEGSASSEGAPSAEGSAQDATKPAEESNRIEAIHPEEDKSAEDKDKDKDSDIKIEINNDNKHPEELTPPDAGSGESFVIDFDDLLNASKK